ncbi:MAG TPA: alpha-amylase family glycosyl hydrolase [Acidimicrobiales bacterium]|nr:alpha-amylase family glycosyl hydrolase [Acidimicrobiales bacterium]
MADVPWWRSGVVYQIYPRSFADSGGDGVGDLEGIRRHLDHLSWLGIDAIWISPFFRSPMKDYGYDVADYCDVDPLFGTLDDFDRLLADAHAAGIKVMIDWVPNHTSDQHPWFVESRASRDNPRADWYVWVDGTPDEPPNNWRCAFTDGPAWEWVEARQQWYLHLFLPEQPDLNWRNPAVVEAMHGTLRFWLDRGVDGFRIDVVHGLLKTPGFPDVTDPLDPYLRGTRYDIEGTIDLVRGFRKVLEGYPGDRAMVGEVYILSTREVARFYGDDDALHMAFNFPPLYAPWEAPRWRARIGRVIDEIHSKGGWPTWVLSNHDNPRHRTRYGSDARARAAAVLLLTLRGTPFVYAGEELGLEDAVVPPERVLDPGGRDGCRAPIPWTGGADHGWGVDDPWLPWPPAAEARNAEAERADASSMLHLYRRLLEARHASPALSVGDVELLSYGDVDQNVLAYRRSIDGDERLVLVNFSAQVVDLAAAADRVIEVASDGIGEGDRYAGRLLPDQALVLR